MLYVKAKLLGHPVHPMLVGFPLAFYTATLVAYVAYAANGDPFWFRLGVVANFAGVLMAAAAAIPGLIDWALGVPAGHPAKSTGLQHMLLNVGALGLFGVDAGVQATHWSDVQPTHLCAVGLSAIGMLLTLGAGFLGWKMVQQHHVGVDLTREQERIDLVNVAQQARVHDPRAHHV